MKLQIMMIGFYCLISFSAKAKIEIIDGDSFWLNKIEMRLDGIDAPEYNQQCYDGEEHLYNCGKNASNMLKKLIKPDVKCKQIDVDRYKRNVVVCESEGKIINKEMVASGWAVAYKKYSKDYEDDELLAKKNKKGIWQGRFMRPELFRAINRK